MRSNMLKVEIMPISVIATITIISFIFVFIGMLFIVKGINQIKQEQTSINFALENSLN